MRPHSARRSTRHEVHRHITVTLKHSGVSHRNSHKQSFGVEGSSGAQSAQQGVLSMMMTHVLSRNGLTWGMQPVIPWPRSYIPAGPESKTPYVRFLPDSTVHYPFVFVNTIGSEHPGPSPTTRPRSILR